MKTKTTLESPVGDLVLVADGDALAGLYISTKHRHAPPLDLPVDDTALPAVREQLTAYFSRDLKEFDLQVDVAGTPFQQQVWAALRTIPYGETWSYKDLAEANGRPTAVRAVGLANGRNPVSIVVPCHRVIGANGSLVGYGGGLPVKQWLLAHEAGSPTWSSDSLL
jgi:methylated-DNA-[protein]-cysteine S-methyltransferase